MVQAAAAQAGPPYPAGNLQITFELNSYRAGGSGGDIWPVTQRGNGALIAAWGDGAIGTCPKVSYGVARIGSGAPNTNLSALHCGPPGTGKGKFISLVGVGNTLYARLTPYARPDPANDNAQRILKSIDGGKSWSNPPKAGNRRLIFAQFGAGNAGAPGGFVYALEVLGTSVHLRRTTPANVQSEASYEFFSGTASSPTWSTSSSASKPILTDAAGVQFPTLQWNPGTRRYLLAAAHSPSYNGTSFPKLGIFDAPNPWGPWTTAYYSNSFMGATGGLFLSFNFPPQWSSGSTSWATFSCHNFDKAGSCGKYHDEFSIVKATLE